MLSFFLGGLVMGFIFNIWDIIPYIFLVKEAFLNALDYHVTNGIPMGANEFMNVPAIYQTFMGGFFFGMVFMATDPVSAAQTNVGKWIYGFLAGFLGIMIRVFNPAYPEGIMMSILFMNVMAPLIDHYVVQANINKRLKRVKVANS